MNPGICPPLAYRFYLGVSVQDILDKIEEFKDQGCKLFE